MSNSTKLQEIIQAILEVPQKVINYLSGAVSRIFGPRDDDYPATGVQPFEGDPPEEKHF
ncbi:MAG: hypothetical protein HEQ35_02010 [Gloeotrichia echinulata IR180]|jgi:hypothetical protein|nr:hypothetical protein [Gloeotrichia echinulata DEX184]